MIDNKTFPVFLNGKFRDYAARRRVRGAYRTRKTNLKEGYVKPPKHVKVNTGAKSAMVMCAIGNGKVLLWHVVEGMWNARAAAAAYGGPLREALQKEYPGVKGRWRVLEDNDPAGYNSRKGLEAKRDAGINAFKLPPRSPDLNPLDYSVWSEVNRRMREQEATWPAEKCETRRQYLVRLKRTAMGLPREYIRNSIGALADKCAQVVAAKGGHIAEGGH